jgi:hypothetical protein
MSNPGIQLRGGQSGPSFEGSTPGHVLTVDTDGKTITPKPAAAGGALVSFNGRTTPAVVPETGDYNSDEVVNTSSVPGDFVSDALEYLQSLINALVAVDASDTTPGFLAAKLTAGAGLALTVQNPGADESIRLDLLTAFAITGFGVSGATLVLAGATVTNPAFGASYNQAATAVSLTDSEGNNDVIALPGTAFVSPHAVTKNAYGASWSFTLHATGPTGTGSATAGASIVWGQDVYFGSAVDPGVYDSAFANSLTATLKLGPQGTYAYNTGALQNAFFWTRTAFGLTPANFTVGGFPFDCSKVAAGVNVTNANGIVEQFDCFRSTNMGLGSFNLVEA